MPSPAEITAAWRHREFRVFVYQREDFWTGAHVWAVNIRWDHLILGGAERTFPTLVAAHTAATAWAECSGASS